VGLKILDPGSAGAVKKGLERGDIHHPGGRRRMIEQMLEVTGLIRQRKHFAGKMVSRE
jgi:hypothetical protein